MIWYAGLSVIIALIYVNQIRFLVRGWKSIPCWIEPPDYKPTAFVTVLVCARNEENAIQDCLQSLQNQSYPQHLFEIILMDNHSTDSTIALAKELGIPQLRIEDLSKVLDEAQTLKKEAISYGLNLAKGEWILITDADCIAPTDWISSSISFAEGSGKKVVAGPVEIIPSTTFLGKYQQIDMAGLMIATGGGLHTGSLLSANGANLLYHRDTLKELPAVIDSSRFASGDDIFLIQAIHQKDPEIVSFLKSREAIITTKALSTWYEFFSQRRRWASKSNHLPHRGTRWINGVVLANACLICAHLVMAIFANKWYAALLAVHLMIKALADEQLLKQGKYFFEIEHDWKQQIFNTIFNPLYITLAGLSVLVNPGYHWKGRNVR